MKRPGKIRELVERLTDEVAELRRECFDLAAELSTQKVLVSALEDVVKATAGMREQS